MDLTKQMTEINKLLPSTPGKKKKVKLLVTLASCDIIKVQFRLFSKR